MKTAHELGHIYGFFRGNLIKNFKIETSEVISKNKTSVKMVDNSINSFNLTLFPVLSNFLKWRFVVFLITWNSERASFSLKVWIFIIFVVLHPWKRNVIAISNQWFKVNFKNYVPARYESNIYYSKGVDTGLIRRLFANFSCNRVMHIFIITIKGS